MSKRFCHWACAKDYNTWETKCNHTFCLNEGDLAENHIKFCCYCGRKIVTSQKISQAENS